MSPITANGFVFPGLARFTSKIPPPGSVPIVTRIEDAAIFLLEFSIMSADFVSFSVKTAQSSDTGSKALFKCLTAAEAAAFTMDFLRSLVVNETQKKTKFAEHSRASNFYNCAYVQKSTEPPNVSLGDSCRTFFKRNHFWKVASHWTQFNRKSHASLLTWSICKACAEEIIHLLNFLQSTCLNGLCLNNCLQNVHLATHSSPTINFWTYVGTVIKVLRLITLFHLRQTSFLGCIDL